MLPVECIARGYLAGLGLKEYEKHGTVSGVALPPGLVEGSKLPEPIFTPTTKAPVGEHDEFMTFAEVEALIGAERGRAAARPHARRLHPRRGDGRRAGSSWSPTRSSSSGSTRRAEIVLADEVLTSDSSRFWPADRWSPGRAPVLLRQAVRARLVGRRSTGTAPRPAPRCPPTSSRSPERGTSRSTSGSPAVSGNRRPDDGSTHDPFTSVWLHDGVARLIVSLSGLTDDSLPRGAAFAEALDARGVAVSQLYRPGAWDARSDVPAGRRGCTGAGQPATRSCCTGTTTAVPAAARVGRRAEFAALPRHEAGSAADARRGARSRRWATCAPTCSCRRAGWPRPGTVEALREQGFRMLADESGVRLLRDAAGDGPRPRARFPCAAGTGAGRREARGGRGVAVPRAVAEVARTARRGGLVRINVRAKDLRRAARVRGRGGGGRRGAGGRCASPLTYRLAAARRAA